MKAGVRRVFLIVLDSFGIGALPDASAFGDAGADTLGSCARTGKLRIPHLLSLGLGNIEGVQAVAPCASPCGAYGRAAERSAGKDTTVGHWELAGLISAAPLPTFPQGFPPEVIAALRLLTHDAKEDYFDYIRKIKPDPIARAVKIEDLKHNSDLSRMPKDSPLYERAVALRKKYAEALAILAEE